MVDKAHLLFISLAPLPQGPQGGSTDWNFYVEFDFLGLECDHAGLKQLEAKNLSKRAKLLQKRPYSGGFLLLTALNHYGRTPNLKNRILHKISDL